MKRFLRFMCFVVFNVLFVTLAYEVNKLSYWFALLILFVYLLSAYDYADYLKKQQDDGD